jgi:polyisoprenyl-teichoic acid--peptidoglycan teichoic acid transferase
MNDYFDRLEAQLGDLHEQGRHLRRFPRWSSRALSGVGAMFVVGTAVAVAAVAIVALKPAHPRVRPPLGGMEPALGASVQTARAGAPQTLLVIVSDHRLGTSYASSNTQSIVLVRLDGSGTIKVLAIPSDLRIQLPGGPAKLNAAYAEGGPNLLIRTLKAQVFQGLQVNHILDVNVGGFSDLVDGIGCVYSDVDHRYYNNTARANYPSIDLQPGYQKLCGSQALQFVQFRHADSDILRDARLGDFARWAEGEISVSQLLAQETSLLRAFGAHVQTDHSLHTTSGLLNLFDLLVNSVGQPPVQTPFPAIFDPCKTTAQLPCYITASRQAEATAYQVFMAPATAPGPNTTTPKSATTYGTAGLVSEPSEGQSQALALRNAGLPIYYPSLILAGSRYCSDPSGDCTQPGQPASESAGAYPRAYQIEAEDGHTYPAYRMTLTINAAQDEYYGIQGTTWLGPPLLRKPTRTQVEHGRRLLEYFDGAHLSVVAFETGTATYWVSNTLTNGIPNQQLIGIAASMQPHG